MSDRRRRKLDAERLTRTWRPISWLERELSPLHLLAEQRGFGFVLGCPDVEKAYVIGGDKYILESLGRSTIPLRADVDRVAGMPAQPWPLHPCGEETTTLGFLILFGQKLDHREGELATDIANTILRLRWERAEACSALTHARKRWSEELPQFHAEVADSLDHRNLHQVLLKRILSKTMADGALLHVIEAGDQPLFAGMRGPLSRDDEHEVVESLVIPELATFRGNRSKQYQGFRLPRRGSKALQEYRELVLLPLWQGSTLQGLVTLVAKRPGALSGGIEQVSLWSHEVAWALYLRGRLLARQMSPAAPESDIASTIRHRVVGSSQVTRRLRAQLTQAARTESPVLLIGATGTGKELAARAIHEASQRKGRFVPIDCPALTESLAESALFGHAAGSFTGASGERSGLFEHARGGTVFLDEIVDMPATIQLKLLRVLETARIRRLGEDTEREVDVRIIAAASDELLAAVSTGRLRRDLYWRLAVVPIKVPSLIDRREDILQLIQHFLDQHKEQTPIELESHLPVSALDALKGHSWPGNIRQLRNVVDRIATEHMPGPIDGLDMQKLVDASDIPAPAASDCDRLFHDLLERRGTFERLVQRPFKLRELRRSDVVPVIEKAVKRAGNYKEAARLLNVAGGYQQWMDFLRNNKLKAAGDGEIFIRDEKKSSGAAITS